MCPVCSKKKVGLRSTARVHDVRVTRYSALSEARENNQVCWRFQPPLFLTGRLMGALLVSPNNALLDYSTPFVLAGILKLCTCNRSSNFQTIFFQLRLGYTFIYETFNITSHPMA